jgi:hypothetical protein
MLGRDAIPDNTGVLPLVGEPSNHPVRVIMQGHPYADHHVLEKGAREHHALLSVALLGQNQDRVVGLARASKRSS